MTRTRTLILCGTLAVAALGGAVARAGFTPAWSYLPAPLRAQLAAKMGGSLYLPARTPLFYRYRSGATVANGTLTVPFTNRVRVSAGVWRWTAATFNWKVQPLPAGTDCVDWQTKDKTLQLTGNKVYWSAETGTAWRCVVDRSKHTFVLSATNGAKLPDAGLGSVVASGLDVSARTSGIRTALTVTPKTVKRGRTVLVQGLAGGCTLGDSVTILSKAFPSTHSFASVPAVYAQVGPQGRFSAKVRIPATKAAGSYGITGRCGGGNLGVEAFLTVTR
jgi:hypothetical protein